MKKNQKYSPRQMTAYIEKWKGSKLTQRAFCINHCIPLSSFNYWLRKHKEDITISNDKTDDTFIPIKVTEPGQVQQEENDQGFITISYPNGVNLCCPVNIPIQRLTALIKL